MKKDIWTEIGWAACYVIAGLVIAGILAMAHMDIYGDYRGGIENISPTPSTGIAPTITREPQIEPTATPTITLSPAPTEEPKLGIYEVEDDAVWELYEQYPWLKDAKMILLSVKCDEQVVTFYMAYVKDEWHLVQWIQG